MKNVSVLKEFSLEYLNKKSVYKSIDFKPLHKFPIISQRESNFYFLFPFPAKRKKKKYFLFHFPKRGKVLFISHFLSWYRNIRNFRLPFLLVFGNFFIIPLSLPNFEKLLRSRVRWLSSTI